MTSYPRYCEKCLHVYKTKGSFKRHETMAECERNVSAHNIYIDVIGEKDGRKISLDIIRPPPKIIQNSDGTITIRIPPIRAQAGSIEIIDD